MGFLFGNKEDSNQLQALTAELDALEVRWKVFLDKLRERFTGMLDETKAEAAELFKTDTDQYRRTYARFRNGIQGQLQTIFDKASNAHKEQILERSYDLEHDFSNSSNATHSKARTIINSWKHRCDDNYFNKWQTVLRQLESSTFKEIEKEDSLETRYQAILTEHEIIMNKFSCIQCGGMLKLEKIFFIATYITCPYCQTQNTFQPSAKAQQLEDISRPLAEQRCMHLQQAYLIMVQRAKDLFDQRHQLKSRKIRLGKKDKKEKHEIESNLAITEQELKLANEQKPVLYESYIKAVFAEINKIVPDLKEQNDKFCLRLLEDHKAKEKYDYTRMIND